VAYFYAIPAFGTAMTSAIFLANVTTARSANVPSNNDGVVPGKDHFEKKAPSEPFQVLKGMLVTKYFQ